MTQSNYTDSQPVKLDEFTNMIKRDRQFFDKNLGELSTKHDKFLIALTIDDLALDKLVDDEKSAATDRTEWIKLVSTMSKEGLEMFALLTLYRNSGIAVLHYSALSQILDNVILPYTNLSDHTFTAENLNRLLFHILVIAKIMKHYDELFSYGLINFVTRDNADLLTNERKNSHVFRISFSKLGNIVHTERISRGVYSIVKHSIFGEDCASNMKRHSSTKYKGSTLKCETVEVQLYDKAEMIDYMKHIPNVYNAYDDAESVKRAFINHILIQKVNNNTYAGIT